MNMIGIDLWTESYVVLKDKQVICTENTVDYIEQQMNRQAEEEITLTVASWVKDITIILKKSDIVRYYSKEEKSMRKKILIVMSERTGQISKEKVLKKFLKQISICRTETEYHVCNDILTELDNIECIQIYDDNVVRLHLKAKNHFNSRTSIIIEEYIYGTILKEILYEIIP